MLKRIIEKNKDALDVVFPSMLELGRFQCNIPFHQGYYYKKLKKIGWILW